ncbi:MGDG synthase family glycosyltransferase [Salinibacillus xinjiangensis]|uniref:UDP-glucuronosyltransferase n=1 Tax=Salinibacillus xinjiangensis TaxID=1229268 RepID=A0A6G1X7Y3_9BACI|nr:UDP-glucuronosyltransferase [Salinibacillus xinjiangensis]MRG87113.1 UDP-glucuronosyltransferase [Salinibacillus xinjiangensis]
MKKVLFMPFLQISSGHHQVADSLMDGLRELEPTIECEKVDILHYGFGKMETFISNVYLQWIAHFPQVYSWIYRKLVCENMKEAKRYRHYEFLFQSAMKEILQEKKPDLVICTHALPSYMLSYLKQRGLVDVPVINVYTDYFIHRLWGISEIDYHFVPSHMMKEHLEDKGVRPDRIFVTGIPVHHKFSRAERGEILKNKDRLRLMLTGGNLGVGLIDQFVEKVGHDGIEYKVLCGKNDKLYKRLSRLGQSNVQPVSYISSREEMNQLYEECDGIITKPGGVTVSESLFKRVPIFVYHTLPGQEEMNLEQLNQLGVANHLHSWQTSDQFEEELLRFYNEHDQINTYHQNLDHYHTQITPQTPAELIYFNALT